MEYLIIGIAVIIGLVIIRMAYIWYCICFGVTDELKKWADEIRSRTKNKNK